MDEYEWVQVDDTSTQEPFNDSTEWVLASDLEKATEPSILGVPDRKTWRTAFSDMTENFSSYIPYLNMLDIVDSAKIFLASKAVENGTATVEQNAMLNDFLADRQREQSIGYKFWSTVLRMPAYALEFISGGELVKGIAKGTVMGGLKIGLKVGGLQAARSLAKRGAIEAGVKGVFQKMGSQAALKLGAKVTKGSVGYKLASFLAEDVPGSLTKAGAAWISAQKTGTATDAALAVLRSGAIGLAGRRLKQSVVTSIPRTFIQAHRVVNNVVMNMTPSFLLTEDEQGQMQRILIDDGDDFLPAFAKAFGDVAIENFSEETSESFIILKGLFGPAASRIVKGSFLAKAAERIGERTGKGKVKAMKDLLYNHFLGRDGKRGVIEQMGFNGVIAELGEEVVGGAMRQAVGISPVGLPSLEDVAAMGMAFMLNPLAIASAANTGFADVYTNHVIKLKASTDKLKNSSDGMLKDSADAEDLRTVMRDFINYIKAEDIAEGEGKLNGLDKMMRFLIWDNVHRRVGERLGEEISSKFSDADAERFGFDRLVFSQYVFDATAKNANVIDDKLLNNMIETMMGVRFVSEEEAQIVSDHAVGEDRADVQYQNGVLVGRRSTGPTIAPIVFVEQGDMDQKTFDSWVSSRPWLISTQKYDAPTVSAIQVVDSKTLISNVTEKKKGEFVVSDEEVYGMASMLGISQVESHTEQTGKKGQGLIMVNSIERLRTLVSEKANRINKIAVRLPQGRKIAIAPSIGLLDQRQNFTGQPISDSIPDFNDKGEILMFVGAHWSPSANTITISPSSLNADIDEDVIESIINPPDQAKLDEYVHNFAEAIRNSSEEAKEELHGTNDIEIFSKISKTVVFGNAAQGDADLSSFVKRLNINVDKVVDGGIKGISGYLNWKAAQAGASESLFEHLGTKESVYDRDATYDHPGFIPTFSKNDLKQHYRLYERDKKRKVDKNFSLVLEFTPRLHAVRYAATTKQYLTKAYMDNRGKLDDKEFGEAILDKHGRTILPYLLKFVDDLYSGEIVISQQDRKDKREATAEPKPKLVDEDVSVPPVASVKPPVARLDTGEVDENVPPVRTVSKKPDKEVDTEEAVDTEEVDTEADVPAVKTVIAPDNSLVSDEIELTKAVQIEKDIDAEAKQLSEDIKATLTQGQLRAIENIENAKGTDMASVMLGRIKNIQNFSLRPEDQSTDNNNSYKVLDGIRTVEDLFQAHYDGDETPTGTDKNPISEDKSFNDAYQKIREITQLVDDAVGAKEHIGSEAYYRIAKGHQLEPGWADAVAAINKFIPKEYKRSMDKFFDNITKVPYKYIALNKRSYKGADGKRDVQMELRGLFSSFGRDNGVDITESWYFTDVSKKKRPAVLMHSFGLQYLNKAGRPYYMLDGISSNGGKVGSTAASMTNRDRRNTQIMLYNLSVTEKRSTFDLIFSRFGSKALTPVVEMPRYSGDSLAMAKAKYTKKYNALSERAKAFIGDPAKMKSDFEWNVSIGRDTLFTELFGSYDVFFGKEGKEHLDLYNLMKRTEQVFTPGVSSDTKAKYLVFEDKNEFDGKLFFGDNFTDAYYEDVGRIFINPDMANFIKGFLIYNNPQGNMVSIKPLMYNINALVGKPYYDEIKKHLDKLNAESDVPVFLIPASSVKVWGKAGDMDIAGEFKDGMLTLEDGYSDKLQDIEAGDIVVVNDVYNFSLEDTAQSLLRQVEGLNLLYEDEDLLYAQDMYNTIFDTITRNIAEDLSFSDVVKESKSVADDDVGRFSDIQRAIRLGLSTDEIVTGPDSIKAISVLSSSMAKIVSPVVNRTIKVTTAPGEAFDEKRTLRWDAIHGLMPAEAQNGKVRDEESLAVFDSDEELIRNKVWFAHMFEIDADGSVSSRIREKLVVRENGKLLVPRDIGILTRIPASSVAFSTVSTMMNRSSDAIASFVITDHETNKSKGEDYDADFTFIDGLFREKKTGRVILFGNKPGTKMLALSNRAFLHTVQGYLNASEEIFKASKREPKMTVYDDIILPRKNGAKIPPLTTEAGQSWWDNLVSGSKKSLSIAASQSTVSRYFDYLGVSSKPANATTISNALNLKWDRRADVINSYTQAQKLERDFFFNNILVNMYADDMKDPKVFFMGHDQNTTGLLYALILGNPQITTENDIKEFMENVTKYFESDLIKQYRRYKNAKTSKTIGSKVFDVKLVDFLEAEQKRQKLSYTEEDINGLLFLNDVNSEMIGAKQYIDLLFNRSINNPTQFEKLNEYSSNMNNNAEGILEWPNISTSSRGAVVRRVSKTIDMNYTKIFSKDISLSLFTNRVLSEITKRNQKIYIPRRKVLKNTLLLVAATNAVDKGRGLTKKPLRLLIEGHRRKYKETNIFARDIVKRKYKKNTFGMKPSLFENARELSSKQIEEYRDAFEELPEDVQDDYLLYHLINHGLTYSTFSGQYMRIIGDSATKRLYEGMHEETQKWLDDSKSEEEFEHIRKFLTKKFRPVEFDDYGKPLVPYFTALSVDRPEVDENKEAITEDEASAMEYTTEAADVDTQKEGEPPEEDTEEESNVTTESPETRTGSRPTPGASRNRVTGEYTIRRDILIQNFKDKAWTKPKVEGVTPLPADQFKTINEWFRWIAAHEAANAVILQNREETSGSYENRINAVANDRYNLPESELNKEELKVMALLRNDGHIPIDEWMAAGGFSLTWDNVVPSEAFYQAKERYDKEIDQIIFSKEYNSKWSSIVDLIREDQDKANIIAKRYGMPERLRSKINTLLGVDDDKALILDSQTEEQPDEFAFSLNPIATHLEKLPQFYTTGAPGLHSAWMKIRNKMEEETIRGRLRSDIMLRLAKGLKGLGYRYELNDQAKYDVYDLDRPNADGTYPILPNGHGVTKDEARSMQKKRDKVLRHNKKKDLLTDAQVSHVMSAVTARREDHDTEEYLHVEGEGAVKADAKVDKLPIQPAIDLLGEDQFNKILEQAELAFAGRERISAEMEALAGPQWLVEWKKMDLNGNITNLYIPHFFRKEVDDNGIAISGSREDSNRTQARKFKTYIDAFKDKRQFTPITTDASRLVKMWYEDVWGAAVNRTMITLGATMRDVDAAPLWIPTYNEEYISNDDNDAYQTAMNKEQMLVVYDNLKAHLQSLGLRYKRKVSIPEDGHSTEIMVNKLVSNNVSLLKLDGYVQQSNSRFKSITNWWVKKGEASENLLKMVERRPLEWRFFGGRNWAIGINRFNNWSKNLSLSLSAFHPVALIESLIAIGGLTGGNVKALFHLPSTIQDIKNSHKKAMSDPASVGKWIGHSLRLNPSNPNFDNNQLFKDANFLEKEFSNMGLGHLSVLTKGWKGYNKLINRYLWSDFLPAVKLWSAEHVYSEVTTDYKNRGISYDEDQVLTEISQLTNDAFGGQNWDQYIWATPERMQLLHLMMFAPDWCCDEKTRAFTKTGFKYRHELKLGDEILIHDPNTNTNRWGNLNDMYVNKNYSGDMVNIKNYNRKIMITPEHTCRVIHDKSRETSTIKAKELSTHHMIPRCAPMDLPTEETLDDRLIRIVGWMVTDGCYCYSSWRTKEDGSKTRYQYGRICQNKLSGIKDLDSLDLKYYTENAGKGSHGKYHNNRATRRYYIPARYINAMHEAGIKDNNLTWEFLSKLSKRQLELLYKTMMLGDGTGQNRFCGKEQEVFNMTMLQTILGLPTTFYQQEENCWRTRTIESKHITCAGDRKTTEHYEGTIWCPSVDTGFWVAEREGLIFITGNTISAFNVSGAPNLPVLRDYIKQSPLQKEWQLKRYWPGMAVLVMAGIPQAVQLAIYSIAKVTPGPDDPDAKPFLFQNEQGKAGYGGIGGSIDVTPILKKFGYKGDTTGKRRIYMRWAKQANEVFEGWAKKPLHTLMAKTSPAAKTALEQMVGTNTAGWTLGFKDKTLMNGLFSGEKGFADSRVSYIGQKFIPMSILTAIQGRPTSFFAPMSKGMSNYVAQTKLAQVLTAYADDDVWGRIKDNDKYKANLAVLAPGLLEAAERNGLNPENVLTAARRHTLATLYNRFFKQLNKSDYVGVNKTAEAILRVNGTLKGLEKSLASRSKKINKTLSTDDLEMARQAFGN